MAGNLLFDLNHFEIWSRNPLVWLAVAFQIWMLVDSVRRQEWIWAILIFLFSFITALLYFFLVYRQAVSSLQPLFEVPGAAGRQRIRELEAQIQNLDKAHHHSELGDIYFKQGKLQKAVHSYRNALERDPHDLDTQSHLGQALLQQNQLEEARRLLEQVCGQDPRHDYGQSQSALGEAYAALGRKEEAIASFNRVIESHSYAHARVRLAELLLETGQAEAARQRLNEVIEDDKHAPAFQKQRDRHWVKKAGQLLKQAAFENEGKTGKTMR
jgi:hypothetical protein